MDRRSRGRGRGRGQNREAWSWQQTGEQSKRTSVWNQNGDCARKPSNPVSRGIKNFEKGKEPGTDRKFEEACAKIQESLQRFVRTQELESSSSEEDELESEGILNKVLSSYEGSRGDSNDFSRTRQNLLDTLKPGASVCLICIETVKRTDSVWSCIGCYCILHLTCIQKWSKDSLYHQTHSNDENIEINSTTVKWCCPKCRKEYTQMEIPQKYLCFCGKTANPSFDPWLIPHSCGRTCERKLQPLCGHVCLLLCHSGPCPPCPKTVKTNCYCGRKTPEIRRCSAREWSCGQRCGHLLPCGQHNCDEPCHGGPCPPCPRQSFQSCMCGRKKTNRPCASPKWQCGAVCGKKLSCGNHFCEKVCHEGVCGRCPRAGPRSCPYGKTMKELPCTEDVPVCGDSCEKLLECGIHRCTERCHPGPCGTCRQMRVKRCRCGQREKSVPCSKEYTCETKCKQLRDCRRHTCSRKCCDGQCPSCEQQCNRTLMCRNHKCNSRCHQGPCYPCRVMVDVTCKCGKTKITVPCGRVKATKPPRCRKPCCIPPACRHPSRDPHRCHFGNCPPCSQICNEKLDCGHICPVVCHIAVLTKIEPPKIKRAGPWEVLPPPRIEELDYPCPPCQVPVPVTCYGKHETPNFPCSEARPWSCGKPCGRLLSCGNHSCPLECHTVINAATELEAGETCQPCEESCSKARPEGCTHFCLLLCHPDSCPPCQQRFRKKCHCQLNTVYIPCYQWTFSTAEEREKMLSCQSKCPKMISCGHRCSLLCHQGECPSSTNCKKKVTVRCQCKRQKQEFHCTVKQSGEAVVLCDDLCAEVKEKEEREKLALEQKMKEEEQKRQQKELEELQRKFEVKRRKHRKFQKDVTSEDTGRPVYQWMIAVCLSGIAMSIFLYCCLLKD
ncbi:NF-X1-type zinc finger protein NFXL1 [Tachypleus tridentatus]|uniref:NF-X1-type zinc finger protein NFXL1 n=1 Tax=Tachypleus tridentatus TaxID=6853 RepID=UPI003FD5F965